MLSRAGVLTAASRHKENTLLVPLSSSPRYDASYGKERELTRLTCERPSVCNLVGLVPRGIKRTREVGNSSSPVHLPRLHLVHMHTEDDLYDQAVATQWLLNKVVS